MSEDELWFELYYDEAASRMLPRETVDGSLVWALDFGRLNAGEDKTSEFYIKNVSKTIVEDLKVEIGVPTKEKVSVRIVSEALSSNFEPGDVHRVAIEWVASSGAKAGRCREPITITGMIQEEHYRYE